MSSFFHSFQSNSQKFFLLCMFPSSYLSSPKYLFIIFSSFCSVFAHLSKQSTILPFLFLYPLACHPTYTFLFLSHAFYIHPKKHASFFSLHLLHNYQLIFTFLPLLIYQFSNSTLPFISPPFLFLPSVFPSYPPLHSLPSSFHFPPHPPLTVLFQAMINALNQSKGHAHRTSGTLIMHA